ncbi:hypothetical protein A2862_02105 [Candidatus Roizmanbacteria bacterium RIFCSPHIGHO2_01_FULL_38_41]|uniref:Glycosyltransferase 2-like domain-containing protein n=1 Tax=Candidatus Roizmanbacteria bacterium RIFCSPHIGHO2_02_FULL_37_24 TaxID=1802037 RepID=A0A1F7GWD9_9BACT|nr:MAG: hypothetical protein A2862_02105 [Candidatus Roizmanbacteria bacterium RIFCSPHIGHO2_01_FULL_38_41]OGK23193.1 MAG: hypothetical protein A3C24_00860 [Candidatus Roizmanbacteria bacterium RIFCSPHIGHO2_02_FULL_37_24]OGK32467.1 MAG: hypothetical protein A3E10_01270 [Candidatus Roizmanbacteria bacterium RIFCSPHIGHO2_12_FULL_37_23]OGK43606.1 MAG: hypothetical protein A2956_04205 [Candidatus Roizmanbacteria bacterium RIFCSPLOWO2_01_FULL_37_57]
MRKSIDFSIVFPVMNQQDHIERVISEYHKILTQNKYRFELIPVVNGTHDKSYQICKSVAEKLPNVYTYELKAGGYGLGILHGIKHSRGKYICYLNCARIKAKDLVQALNLFEQHPKHVIHGVRIQRENTSRSLGSIMYNTVCKMLFSISSRDINGNPNIFSRNNFEQLQLSYLNSMIDLELLDKAKKLNIPISEIEIFDYTRHGGISTSNFKTIFRLMKEVSQYWINTRLIHKDRL